MLAPPPFSHEAWRAELATSTAKFAGEDFDPAAWEAFAASVFYHAGDVGIAEDFDRMRTFLEQIEGAAKAGADRVELYTEPYASRFPADSEQAIFPYIESARVAKESGLGVNAGHDLDLHNLRFLKTRIPFLDEVSIGHALICDALYFGLENTIQLYLQQLRD